MSTNLTPVDTFTTTITVPDAGEAGTSASLTLPIQAIANRSENNNSRLNSIPVANSSTVVLDILAATPQDDATGLSKMSYEGAGWRTISGQAPTRTFLFASLNSVLPIGATLDTVTAYVDGGTVHLPANLPNVEVFRVTLATNSVTSLGLATDPSASGAAYGQPHSFSLTSIAHTVLASNTYLIAYGTEAGTSSTSVDADYYGLEVAYTVA